MCNMTENSKSCISLSVLCGWYVKLHDVFAWTPFFLGLSVVVSLHCSYFFLMSILFCVFCCFFSHFLTCMQLNDTVHQSKSLEEPLKKLSSVSQDDPAIQLAIQSVPSLAVEYGTSLIILTYLTLAFHLIISWCVHMHFSLHLFLVVVFFFFCRSL